VLRIKAIFNDDKREMRGEKKRIEERKIFSRRMIVSAKAAENIVFSFYLILL